MAHTRCFLCGKKQEKGRALHRIPKSPKTRPSWITFCKLNEATDDVSKVFVCSEHFAPGDYIEPRAAELGNRLLLKPGSVPSIPSTSVLRPDFPSTSKTLKHAVDPESSELRQSLISDESNCNLILSEGKKTPIKRPRFSEPRYLSEVRSSHLATPRGAQRCINLAKHRIMVLSNKVKLVRQKNRRLLKKIGTLEDLIYHLTNRHFLLENTAESKMVCSS